MSSDKNYCLITGASNGIGKSMAEECVKRGINLFLVALPDSGLEEFVGQLTEKKTVDVKHLSIDLTGLDAPKRVYDFTKENNIAVNMLINNAGVGGLGLMVDQKAEDIDTMIMLNVRATTLLTYYFLNDLKQLPKAYILNVSSFAAFMPIPKKCVYSATKAYILFFSRSLQTELKGSNVMVTSIHPNGVATNERIKRTMQNAPFLGKISALTPEEAAVASIEGALKGKKLIAPGKMTKVYYYFGSCLPYGLVNRIVGKVFSKAT
jgi:short-subunit dehydrogenase